MERGVCYGGTQRKGNVEDPLCILCSGDRRGLFDWDLHGFKHNIADMPSQMKFDCMALLSRVEEGERVTSQDVAVIPQAAFQLRPYIHIFLYEGRSRFAHDYANERTAMLSETRRKHHLRSGE